MWGGGGGVKLAQKQSGQSDCSITITRPYNSIDNPLISADIVPSLDIEGRELASAITLLSYSYKYFK